MNWKKIVLIVVALVFIGAQFFVDKSNVSDYKSVEHFEKGAMVDNNLKQILQTNCYDCHSDHTNYPWYSNIGVVNLFLSHHIEEGKEHLNFSNWANYDMKKQAHKLEEIYEEVEEGEMPMKIYNIIHGSFNEESKQAILSWAKPKK